MITPPDDAKIHDLPTTKFWLDEIGIVYAVSKGKDTQTIEEAESMIKYFKSVVGDDKVCLMIDVSNSTETPREVRDYAAQEFPKIIKAIAMLSDSALGKMVANLFFTLKHQPYPTKFFNDEKKAKEWLKQYL